MAIINNKIDISDRGVAYGDGLFETIAVIHGVLQHWDLHWPRLIMGAKRLALNLPAEKDLLANIDLNLENTEKQIIKIIITRGSGGRGYLFPEPQCEHIIITSHRWPERKTADYLTGINVIVCRTCLSIQPALVGIKHLNRLEQVLARNEFDDKDYQEGIMLSYNTNSNQLDSIVVEGTSSNLFFVKDSVLCTPKIDTCGVSGTMRQAIISSVQASQLCSIEEGKYSLRQLAQATEVFFSNSIYGIIPVASIRVNESQQWFYNERSISSQLAEEFNSPLMHPTF
ncbi:MAG: aminodeoxychorismate lyase [gamma proteobacterium symbiont of Taylorina sp.]|nr:aminodeoxychorismate lyase [gamma proteobacterium symbiont of Taylorina sp.]